MKKLFITIPVSILIIMNISLVPLCAEWGFDVNLQPGRAKYEESGSAVNADGE